MMTDDDFKKGINLLDEIKIDVCSQCGEETISFSRLMVYPHTINMILCDDCYKRAVAQNQEKNNMT